ncbi:hypothetical protein Taro_015735, partial [Colocasia esculenta]|nr:hypothetical protein [Colocasia esculenta]
LPLRPPAETQFPTFSSSGDSSPPLPVVSSRRHRRRRRRQPIPMTPDMKEGGGDAEAEEGEEEVAAACAPVPTAEAELQRVATHVDSAISSSYSVKSFPGKWQPIRTKLAQLSCGLTFAAATGRNSVLWELLRTITATVEEAQSLALCCSNDTYEGGKLLMRSNLDRIATKLELHVRSLAGIYASGVLTHAGAIIVPKPGDGASREDWRFYVRDLFSRMKVGGAAMRTQALSALNEVLHGDEKLGTAAFAESPDVVALLVGFLDFSDVSVQEEALDAVSVVAGFGSHRPALVLADVVAPLVRILEKGTALGKERSAVALRKLTENSDNTWAVSAHGGVAALLELCYKGSCAGEVVASACGVLRNLAGVWEVRRYMVERGAALVFVELTRSKEEVLQVMALELLQVLVGDGDEDARARVMREGGVDALVRVLHPESLSSCKARETALRAIQVLCYSPSSSVNALMATGFLDRVLFFLRNGETSLQGAALKAAWRFSTVSDESRKAMGDAGFMPELMGLVETAKSPEVRETAAAALAQLVAEQRNRRKFVLEEENRVGRILRLLVVEGERAAATTSLLAVLSAIADSNSGRRKIASCRYVEHLQRLADMDVADAKRIIKKLSGNKFMNILSGIWSS